jgi:F0F1-type ATP synthase assembly protein I
VSGATEFDPAPGTVDPTGQPVGGSHTVTSSGDERSLGQIVGDLTNDLTTLVKQELALAKTELKEEAGKAGKGAGMLGGAGVAGLLALIVGSIALAFLLDHWLPRSASFAIVMLLWLIIAGVLASMGKKELKNANPQLPETQQTLKEDAAWARAQKN